ncbi:hypothetical protein B1J93_11205 [Leptospira kirschneri serovar Pomona]|uniref:Uncharacterized protein n=1 Tax=Leptospira kirschneri serovar Pomona TaxID=561005 RepID=A0A1T1DMN3_9LEPT|nr:hypothetical protein B1J93_11205 [Leptospira kirschneri serovar Pomona]
MPIEIVTKQISRKRRAFMRAEEEKTYLNVIQVDEAQLKKNLSESVEETLNSLLDAEIDKQRN